jgi:uncharacterized membrane protein YdbT with pleckstrin-like domain
VPAAGAYPPGRLPQGPGYPAPYAGRSVPTPSYGQSPYPPVGTGYRPYAPLFQPPSYGPPPQHYVPGPPPRPPVRFSEGTHRLHWATAPLRAFAILIVYFVLLGMPLLLTRSDGGAAVNLVRFTLVTVPFVVVAVAAGIWGWLSVRFRVENDDLVVVTGVLRKRTRSIPLSRVQAIDVVRPLVTRFFRLSEVRVEAAGGEQSEIILRYLGRDAGQALRAELLAIAAGLPGQTPEAPERHFWKVRYGQLLGSLAMRLPVLGTFLLLIGSLMFMVIYGEPAILAVTVPALLGLIRSVVAPAVMYAGFRVAVSPDGLRLRYGMLETRMQTLPPGRVQAVGIVEPALWRSVGWARLEITVAGYAGDRQALSSVLLPVAPRSVCMGLVRLLFMLRDVDAIPLVPPAQFSIALDHPEGAGADDVLFVSRHGWPGRRTDVIPVVRAQSVRMTVNPLQKMLGLATVHVDAPSGPIRVRAADRELGEARAMVESIAKRSVDPRNAPSFGN